MPPPGGGVAGTLWAALACGVTVQSTEVGPTSWLAEGRSCGLGLTPRPRPGSGLSRVVTWPPCSLCR